MSPVFQLLGLVVMVALFFVALIMALIALLGLPEPGTAGRYATRRKARRTTIFHCASAWLSAWSTWV